MVRRRGLGAVSQVLAATTCCGRDRHAYRQADRPCPSGGVEPLHVAVDEWHGRCQPVQNLGHRHDRPGAVAPSDSHGFGRFIGESQGRHIDLPVVALFQGRQSACLDEGVVQPVTQPGCRRVPVSEQGCHRRPSQPQAEQVGQQHVRRCELAVVGGRLVVAPERIVVRRVRVRRKVRGRVAFQLG